MADTLTIVDNRTGKKYELPIQDGTIRAMDLRQIKTGPDDFGLMTYDPAFMNTANCRSAITYIDGDKGILLYRGYPDRAAGRRQRLPRDRVSDPVRRAADRGAAAGVDAARSPCTRCCTRTSRSSWRASGTTRTRWGSSSARSARCRRSIPTRSRSSTRSRACGRRTG